MLGTVHVGQQPHGVAVDSVNRRVYIANHRSNSLTVIDADTLEVVETISLGDAVGPNGLAVLPASRRIFVAAKFTNSLSAVDASAPDARTILWRAPTGSQPDGVALHSQLPLAYVANFGGNSLTAVDLEDGGTLDLPARGEPSFLAFDPVSERLFVSNHLDGSLSIYNWMGEEQHHLKLGVGSYGLAFDGVRRLVYVANIDSRTVSVIALDSAGDPIRTTGIQLNCRPWTVGVHENNGRVYAVCPDEQRVHIYRPDDYAYVGWLPTGRNPGEGIAFDPATNRIFITNAQDDSVTVIADGGPVLGPTPTPTLTPTPSATLPPVCPAVADLYEPDNSPDQARLLPMDLMTAGGSLHQPGEADWFRLEIPAREIQPAYLFEADVADPDLLVRMELFAGDGATLLTTGFGQVLLNTPAQGGLFYLRMSNSSAYADCNSSYTLRTSEVAISKTVYAPGISGGEAGQAVEAQSQRAMARPVALTQPANALALDGDRLFSAGAGSISRQSADGGLVWQVAGDARPQQLLIGPAALYASGWGAPRQSGWIPLNPDPIAGAAVEQPAGSVLLYDPESGAVRARIDGLERPSGLAVNGAGLWIAETGAHRLLLADPVNGRIVRRLELDDAPYVLRAAEGGVFVTLPGANRVLFVENSGVVGWQAELDGLGLPQDIALDRQSNRLYVLYLLAPRFGQVAVLDAGSGERLATIEPTLSRPLRGAQALAVDESSGRLLVSTILGVEQFALADLQAVGRLSGGWFAGPFGFVVESAPGGFAALWAIDGRTEQASRLNR